MIHEDSPLCARGGRNLVIRVSDLDIWWGHLRQVLSHLRDPASKWRIRTDLDLVEANRPKSFDEDGDGGDSIWDEVVPPDNLAILPMGRPGRKDVVYDALLARIGKGKSVWLVLGPDGEVSKSTKAMTHSWEVVSL